MLPDGSIVYQDANSVKRINMKKEVLMAYNTEREVHSVSALTNGNYLVSLSGQSQIDGHGLDRQLDAVSKYAEANGYEVIKVFKE